MNNLKEDMREEWFKASHNMMSDENWEYCWKFIEDFIDRATMAERERCLYVVKELDKSDYIPVQVKLENPSAWAMYSTGRENIFKAIAQAIQRQSND